MATANETGHAVNTGNFKVLAEKCVNIDNYNPSNKELTIAAIRAQLTEAEDATTLLHTLNGTKIQSINYRQTKFDRMDLYATRIQAALGSSGIDDPKFLADVMTILRKMKGTRAKPKGKPDPNVPEAVQPQHISASQQSRDNQLDHMEKIIKLLSTDARYAPNEAGLSIADLSAYHREMNDANSKAITDTAAAKKQELARNVLLYGKPNGLVATAGKIKNYVRSIKDIPPAVYKEIKAIPFRYYKF